MVGGNFELVAMGNPLLDMQARNAEATLKKYDLKANDAILIEQKPGTEAIYDDITKEYDIHYLAGGAAQNSARCAQYVLPPNSTAYLGSVGEDDLSKQLRAANEREGLHSAYQVNKTVPTGCCAVLITGEHRSLVTRLGAAEKFTPDHLSTPEVEKLTQNAKFFYVGGFFLTHGLESTLILAKRALERQTPFSINLSAPFIPQFFKDQLDQVLPYTTLVIGNESEAEAYAGSHGLDGKDLVGVAKHIAQFESKTNKPRTVIITQGAEETLVLQSDNVDNVKRYPVQKVSSDKIVDTNGAGDAFAGGVLGALILGKSIDEAIEVGHKLGVMCIGQSGPSLKFPKENVL